MKEEEIKHLEIVQGIITRMAGNSFLIKGWVITLTAALFALTAKDANVNFPILALFPVLVFWGLDAYYLRQERLYRSLYDNICDLSEQKHSVNPFSLDTSSYQEFVKSWFKTLWSPTVVFVHGLIVTLIVIVIAAIELYV